MAAWHGVRGSYNRRMSPHRFLAPLVCAIGLCALPLVHAQTPASPAAAAPAESMAPTGVEQKTERIHLEDAGSRIDELRVGGETRTITVSPKGSMPRYEVQPSTANRSAGSVNRSSGTASGGNRVWNVLDF